MRYTVTGADGKLAGRIAENMINEVGGDNLTVSCYKIGNLDRQTKQRWENNGVRIVEANYDDVDSLNEAYKDSDRVYIVSGLEVGKRVQQHKNAIDAAINQGVKHITYSSFVGATDPAYEHVYVTPDHTATENYLKSTGIPYTAMRNNLYLENYLTMYAMLAFMSDNVWDSTAGEGHATLVHKDDCALAATASLLGKGEDFRAYNIVGSESISVRKLCELVSKASGIPLDYEPVDEETYYKYLQKLNIPRLIDGDFSKSPVPFCGADIVTNDKSIADGYMDVKSNDIELLTGQKPKTAEEIVNDFSYVWEDKVQSWAEMK